MVNEIFTENSRYVTIHRTKGKEYESVFVNLEPLGDEDELGSIVKELCDPKILNEAENLANDFELPKGSIIEFLDKKPQSKFSKLCEEYCGIKYLKNGIRDPRVFVDEKKLNDFKTEIECYIKEVKTSGNTKKYAKKALAVKSANILTNVCLSSFLLAMVLPKVTFLFREKMFGEKPEPGLL